MRKSLLKNLPFLVGGVISACVMTSCSNGNKQQVMEEKEYVYVGQGNPYLPLWEHVPDGEPKVFEDPDCPGKFRVYVYGSHDVIFKEYCGFDVRAWSAPVEDLSQWRDEGPVFTYNNGDEWDIMYAPDIVELKHRDGTKEYYLYPNCRGKNREGMVVKSNRPDGPFTPLNVASDGKSLLEGSFIDFDPAAIVEYVNDESDPDYETGFRAYVYWGFQKSHAARLDPNTMWSVMPGHDIINYFIPAGNSYGDVKDPEGTDYKCLFDGEKAGEYNFFEASSIRKVGNKYVFVYSGYSGPEYGIASSNSTLRYAYGDTPLGPWKIGGVLVDNRAPVLSSDGKSIITSGAGHNTHGSIEMINDQWYVFYHRCPRGFGFVRQAMVAPIKVEYDETPVSEGGKVTITGYDPYLKNNVLTVKAANGDEYKGAEVTSEGFSIFGLDPFKYYSAGYACYFSDNNLLQDSWDIWDNNMVVGGMKNGDIIGFKYFGFGGLNADIKGLKAFRGVQEGDSTCVNLFVRPLSDKPFKINIWLDGPWDNSVWKGKKIAEAVVAPDSEQVITRLKLDVAEYVDNLSGKHAVYCVAEGEGAEPLCDIIGIGFSNKMTDIDYPHVPTVSLQINGNNLELPSLPVRADHGNGYTGYDVYNINYQLSDTDELPKVTAFSDNAQVKTDIKQAENKSDEAVVTFDYLGLKKKYVIKFN